MADSRVHIISSYDVDLNDLMKNLWLWEVKFEIFFVEEEAEWLDVFSWKKDQSLFHLLPLIFQADFVWWKVKNYNMLAHSFHLNQERVRVGMKDCMSEKVNVGRDSGAEDPGVNLENVLDDVLNPFRRLKVGIPIFYSEYQSEVARMSDDEWLRDLCGYKSCVEYINEAVQWVLGWAPASSSPSSRAQLNRMADRRVMSFYHTPYGMDYHMQSHRYPLITEVQDPHEDIKKLV
ncbi:hypothetical protein GUITHDRAFT_109693 [Guillardia theta CCMP2712]|uniref:Uncharacterized protein n=1 Tax=Guillardia theta (strain CCMP2712) TaxID=905079 RepID=L1J809_GUITC|nr:hypothetical protein GUITHDRAFT_109693 [Guillardia theta CCMP2712]EKX44234.1 hypothetical protein GUITHDRAFT_109693 [Guillardia theta CCMP2712]|eukprot:XP_005831214.1 hypothetical protein GUITHDRAFT_109693 [Guillardia theta CCMP2712]